ncbi:hypothetical protein ACWGGS_08415 [Streptomyces decoyicus]
MPGDLKYYTVVATIIPLLLLNYFLSIDAPKRVQELKARRNNRFTDGLVTLGGLGPISVLVGALATEAVCLEALFSNRSTATSAIISFFGLAFVVGPGCIHMIIVIILGDRDSAGLCRYPEDDGTK